MRDKYSSTRGGDSELLAVFALRTSMTADDIVRFTTMAVFAQARYSELDFCDVLTLGMSCFASSRGEIHHVKSDGTCLSLRLVLAVFDDTRGWYFESLEILY